MPSSTIRRRGQASFEWDLDEGTASRGPGTAASISQWKPTEKIKETSIGDFKSGKVGLGISSAKLDSVPARPSPVLRKPVGEFWLSRSSESLLLEPSSSSSEREPEDERVNGARAVSGASNLTFIVNKLAGESSSDDDLASVLQRNDSLKSIGTDGGEVARPPRIEIRRQTEQASLPTPISSDPHLEPAPQFIGLHPSAPPLSQFPSFASSLPSSEPISPTSIFQTIRHGIPHEVSSLLSKHGETVFYHPSLEEEGAQPWTANLAAIISGRSVPSSEDYKATLFCALTNGVVRAGDGREKVAIFFGSVLESVRSEAEKHRASLNEARAALRNEQSQIVAIKDAAEEARKEAEVIRRRDVERVTNGFEALRGEVREFADDVVDSLKSELEEAQKVLRRTEEERKIEVGRLEEKHKDELKLLRSEHASILREAKSDASERITDLQLRIKALEGSTKVVEERGSKASAEGEKARKELAELRGEMDRVRKGADEERIRHDKLAEEQKKKLHDSEKELKALREDLDRSKDRARRLEVEKTEASAKLAAEIARKEVELEKLEEKLESLNSELKHTRKEANAEKKKIADLEVLVDSLKGTVEGLMTDKKELEADARDADLDRRKAERELESSKEREEGLAGELDSIRHEFLELKGRMQINSVKDTFHSGSQTEPALQAVGVPRSLDQFIDLLASLEPGPGTIAAVLLGVLTVVIGIVVLLFRTGSVRLEDLLERGCVGGCL